MKKRRNKKKQTVKFKGNGFLDNSICQSFALFNQSISLFDIHKHTDVKSTDKKPCIPKGGATILLRGGGPSSTVERAHRPKRSRCKQQTDRKKAPKSGSQLVSQTTTSSSSWAPEECLHKQRPTFNMTNTSGIHCAPLLTPPLRNWAQVAANQGSSTNKASTWSAPCNLRQRKTLSPLLRVLLLQETDCLSVHLTHYNVYACPTILT